MYIKTKRSFFIIKIPGSESPSSKKTQIYFLELSMDLAPFLDISANIFMPKIRYFSSSVDL